MVLMPGPWGPRAQDHTPNPGYNTLVYRSHPPQCRGPVPGKPRSSSDCDVGTGATGGCERGTQQCQEPWIWSGPGWRLARAQLTPSSRPASPFSLSHCEGIHRGPGWETLQADRTLLQGPGPWEGLQKPPRLSVTHRF